MNILIKMFLFKSLKGNCLPLPSEKHSSSPDNIKTSRIVQPINVKFDENQVKLLTEWLDELNGDKLMIITDQNDLVIMTGGRNDQSQQIFVNANDIDDYMDNKIVRRKTINNLRIISMSDLARILLIYGYVNESSGQLSFNAHSIDLGNNEYNWLKSIIRHARPNQKSNQTDVSLFDGENQTLLSIPYEYMKGTTNIDIVANYLFENGNIQYDVNTKNYVYRYIQPEILLDENIKKPERISQHQFLSYHIKRIDIDQENKVIQLEFRYDNNQYLKLPNQWYSHISYHQFNRDYIIDCLLSNGGIINKNYFIFMGQTYSLQPSQLNKTNSSYSLTNQFKIINLSSTEKNNLISRYIDLIIEKDGTIYDNIKQLFFIENPLDNHRLYFNKEDTNFIKENQFKRQHVIHILNKYSQIKQNQYENYFLYYNNQYIQIPSSIISLIINKNHYLDLQKTITNNVQTKSFERYHNIIDYMYRHQLITWDKSNHLIRLHFSDQTLLLPIHNLNSIIDQNIISSNYIQDGILPFTSRQLSQWLINNSYITRNKY